MSQNLIGSIPPHFGGENRPKIFETNLFWNALNQCVAATTELTPPKSIPSTPFGLGGERRDNEALKSLVCVFFKFSSF